MGQQPSVQYDGIYETDPVNEFRTYLRFYEDGTVVGVSFKGNIESVASWLCKGAEHASQGVFSVAAGEIEFSTTALDVTVNYQGLLSVTGMELNWHSLFNGNRGVAHFRFRPEYMETGARPSLRYDGLYEESSSTEESTNYFRFYEDGVVLSASVSGSGDPESVAKWLNRGVELPSIGAFSVTGPEIEFSTTQMDVTVAYRGQLSVDGMELSWVSMYNGNRGASHFHFRPVPLSPDPLNAPLPSPSPSMLRYDGIYIPTEVRSIAKTVGDLLIDQERKDSNMWEYLRFYRDNTVLRASVGRGADAFSIAKWLHKSHPDVSVGAFSFANPEIFFTLSKAAETVAYRGELRNDGIGMECRINSNGFRYKTEYRFQPIADLDEELKAGGQGRGGRPAVGDGQVVGMST